MTMRLAMAASVLLALTAAYLVELLHGVERSELLPVIGFGVGALLARR